MFAGFAQAEIVPLYRARCLRRGSKSKSRRFCSAASRPNVETLGEFLLYHRPAAPPLPFKEDTVPPTLHKPGSRKLRCLRYANNSFGSGAVRPRPTRRANDIPRPNQRYQHQEYERSSQHGLRLRLASARVKNVDAPARARRSSAGRNRRRSRHTLLRVGADRPVVIRSNDLFR
jgi:hypothetical protein